LAGTPISRYEPCLFNRRKEGNSVVMLITARPDNKAISPCPTKREKIKELVAQGKSLDEIRTAVGDPPANPGRIESERLYSQM
jgi:hypothetical protein